MVVGIKDMAVKVVWTVHTGIECQCHLSDRLDCRPIGSEKGLVDLQTLESIPRWILTDFKAELASSTLIPTWCYLAIDHSESGLIIRIGLAGRMESCQDSVQVDEPIRP